MQAGAFVVTVARIYAAASGRESRRAASFPAHERRRLPGDALIKFEDGCGLSDQVPVWRQPGCLVAGERERSGFSGMENTNR